MAKANVANTLVVPEQTKVAPFYDDFNEVNNYLRILFRPGYAVQARELTQAQTILQNQIERFGRHIFKNGSSVVGGDLVIPPNTHATLKLNPLFGSSNTAITASVFDGKIVTSMDADQSIKFKVLTTTESTDIDPPSLYGEVQTATIFKDNDTIRIKDSLTGSANLASRYSLADSRLAFINDSIFFFNGYFIKVPAQVTVIGKYDAAPSVRVGLELIETIATENDDSSLLDPAQESFNYQAPGAARYKAELKLTTRSLESTDDSKFIELARLENGLVKKLVKYPLYGELEEVLARRTYDESGNYTVRPFKISFDNDRFNSNDYVAAKLSPGKAYIYGYEFETIADSEIRIPKARTTANVSAYDLNMNYGNYVVVDAYRGNIDIVGTQMIDIHCVHAANISYTNVNTYATTKIGTTRIRDIQFFSGDVDVEARKYEFYLFDTNFTPITANVNAVTTNTVSLFTNFLASNNMAYNGATLAVTSGLGAGYSYNIVAYNSQTKTLTISPSFVQQPNNMSNVAIQFDFRSARSFAANVGYTAGISTASQNARANITSLNIDASTNRAFISEPSLGTLLFKLPENYIKPGVSVGSYIYRRKYEGVSFVSSKSLADAVVAPSGEEFVGGGATNSYGNTQPIVMNNYLIVVTDNKGGTRANGEVVKANVTIDLSPEKAVFNTQAGAGDNFTATVYATMEYINPPTIRTKSLKPANTRTFATETSSTIFTNGTGSNTRVYEASAQVVIMNPSRQVGEAESLYLSDVHSIAKIYDLNGRTFTTPAGAVSSLPDAGQTIDTLLSTGQILDATNKYEFNNGQKDTHYDHAFIKLKPNYAPCVGPLIVCVRYYQHSLSGIMTVDSYIPTGAQPTDIVFEDGNPLGDHYSLIPTYKNSAGQTIPLRDCIDFRPVRQNASNTSPNYTMQNVRLPISTTDVRLNGYDYYLGRKDLLVLNANREFDLVQGIPAKNPLEPPAPTRSMVLYTLTVPPYTTDPKSLTIKFIENKRYTMRDIGKIDKRVENLEYFVSLNTLEKKALDINITDVDGLNRTKYGIFADSFVGHALGNSDLEDYQCAMNFKEGWLQNEANTRGFDLAVSSSSGVKIHRDKITLDYAEAEYLKQPYATKYAPVAEFMYAPFNGNIITLPEADIWKDTKQAPDIVVTDQETNEFTTVRVYERVVNSQSR